MSEPAPELPPPPTLVLIEGGAAAGGAAAAPEVGIGAAAIVVVLLCVSIFVYVFILPLVDHIFGTHTHSWFKRIITWPLHKLEGAAKDLVHKMVRRANQALVQHAPGVALWLHGQAVTIERLSGVISAMSQWTYEALHLLRNQTIPRMIDNALQPARSSIHWLWQETQALRSSLVGAKTYVNAMLDDLPWGKGDTFPHAIRQWGGAFRHLWNQFFDWKKLWTDALGGLSPAGLVYEVKTMWDDLYNTGKDSLRSLRTRLTQVEGGIQFLLDNPLTYIFAALGTVAGIRAFQQFFARAEPNLACDETTAFTEELCAAPVGTGRALGNMLPLLLALGVDFALLMDSRQVASVANSALTEIRRIPVGNADVVEHWAGL